MLEVVLKPEDELVRMLQRCCLSLLISHTSQEHQGVPSSSSTTDPALAALYIQLLDNPWALSSPKAVLQRPGSPSPPPCTAQTQITAQLPPGTTQTCHFQRGMLSFPFMRPPSDVPADHRKSTSQNTREMGTLGFAAHTGHRTLSRLWLQQIFSFLTRNEWSWEENQSNTKHNTTTRWILRACTALQSQPFHLEQEPLPALTPL